MSFHVDDDGFVAADVQDRNDVLYKTTIDIDICIIDELQSYVHKRFFSYLFSVCVNYIEMLLSFINFVLIDLSITLNLCFR